jgi:hypothetical protein
MSSPPKVRRWSAEELDALYAGVQEYGTKWAKIKKDPKYANILKHRRTLALKDRIRNDTTRCAIDRTVSPTLQSSLDKLPILSRCYRRSSPPPQQLLPQRRRRKRNYSDSDSDSDSDDDDDDELTFTSDDEAEVPLPKRMQTRSSARAAAATPATPQQIKEEEKETAQQQPPPSIILEEEKETAQQQPDADAVGISIDCLPGCFFYSDGAIHDLIFENTN